MALNNSSKIKEFLSFGDNDFYFLQLLKRKKDNPEMTKDVKVIKSYYINSLDEYDMLLPRIIEVCDKENCRAYIRLNKRNYNKLGLKLIAEIAQLVSNGGDLKGLPNAFDSVAGKYSSDLEKKWIVDVDWVDLPETQKFIIDGKMIVGHSNTAKLMSLLQQLQLETGKEPLMDVIQTKNGFHIVTRPFNLQSFSIVFPNIEVKKDAMTLVYIP